MSAIREIELDLHTADLSDKERAGLDVGRAVNQAARVQDLTRQYDADIILTGELQRRLDPRFALRPLPATRVKGVEEPIAIFAVDGFE